MPLLEVTLRQTVNNQQTLNRWTYDAQGAPAAVTFPIALVSALGAIPSVGVYPVGGLMWLIALTQYASVSFTEITVRDLYDPAQFYSTLFLEPLVGQYVAGQAMPPFTAMGYGSTRTRLDVRRGTKRFAGVPESEQDSGVLNTAFVIGEMADVATAMSDILEYDDEGQPLTFAPVILSREKYTVPGSDPERYAYRYWPTEAEQRTHMMTGIIWSPYNTVRSQTSRQYGRGQ